MRRLSMIALSGTALLALATPALAQTTANPDPWEKFNRHSFALSQTLDHALFRPLAMAYAHILPGPVRDGIHNVLSNLGEPVVAINDILQLRFKRAATTTARLAVNTTLGIGGVFDVASKLGAPHHDNGFDITLGRLHIGQGPYIYIPILGPSSVRDLVGTGVDSLADPLHWTRYPYQTTANIVRPVLSGIDTRVRVDGQLQALFSDATDPYATLRSVYLQNEQSQVNDGQPAAEQPLPDFGDPTPSTTATPVAPPAGAPPAPAAKDSLDSAPPGPTAPTPAAPAATPAPDAQPPAAPAPAAGS